MERRFLCAVILCGGLSFLSACDEGGNKSQRTNDTMVMPADTAVDKPMGTTEINAARVISNMKNLSVFSKALEIVNLKTTLQQPGPFTIFVADNAAFDKLPGGLLGSLMKERKDELGNIISYHIVAGSLLSTDLKDGETLKTFEGEALLVGKKDGRLMINGVNVTTADIPTQNGVIHIIERVLLPKNTHL
jgi:uncharacterized surface protein with fasciclin (FAS1) repeats